MNLNQVFAISLTFGATAALAEEPLLRHSILDSQSVIQFQTQGVCGALELTPNAIYCSPTSFLKEDDGRIGLGLFGEANEQAFKTAYKVMENEIKASDIEKLFRSENFQTVSVHGQTEAIYYQTRLSYSPLHAIGAVLIDNPALPVVQFEGMKQSVLRLTQNFLLGYGSQSSKYFAVLSPEVFYHERKFFYADFDIVSIPAQTKGLVSKKKDNSVEVDFTAGLVPKQNFLPGFGLRMQNMTRTATCRDCRDSVFGLERLVRARSELSFYLPMRHKFGGSILGVATPFFGLFKKHDKIGSALSYVYKIGGLESFFSFSSIKSSFGFVFRPKVLDLGIVYTDEKQDNSISLARKKNTFIYLGYAY
ncbi:MAG: hypothetical protein AB7T49_10475 [Oligoflexales bacterium]